MLTRTLLTWSLQAALMSTMFTIHAEVAQIQSFCPQVIYIWFFHIRSGSLVCASYPISSNGAAVRTIRSLFMWGVFLCLTSVCIDLPLSVSKHTSPSRQTMNREMRKYRWFSKKRKVISMKHFSWGMCTLFSSSVLDSHTHRCYHHLWHPLPCSCPTPHFRFARIVLHAVR